MVRVHLSPFDLEELNISLNGGVAQLGEHLPCKQGVMSSNLTISTRYESTASMYLENRILKISRLTSGKQFRNEELERRNIKTSEVLQ